MADAKAVLKVVEDGDKALDDDRDLFDEPEGQRERQLPDSPILLPSDEKALISKALEIIGACRASASIRASYCRQLNSMTETGRQDGTRSIINKLHVHLRRLTSHMFSPTGLRFMTEYDWEYGEKEINRGDTVARLITRRWSKTNKDLVFAKGVFESLKYGSCIFKQWAEEKFVRQTGKKYPIYRHGLVMPWQFGVYNESVADINRQPVLCETILLTLPEVWKRIWRLPNAKELYQRIVSNSSKGQAGDDTSASFFHQVLSTTTINTGLNGMTQTMPGGIVGLNQNPNYAIIGPEVDVPLVRMHELWVWDGDDYTTVQLIEPDILIAPRMKRSNLLISGQDCGLHPYTMIQPNNSEGYIWGRSEIVDLIEPQGLLSTWADDAKRLFGLQVDKILGFIGFDGITDEVYDARRVAGYFNGPPGSDIKDLTPQFPPQTIEMLRFAIQIIDQLGGFDNMLNGSGQPGVRSAEQMDIMMRAASPSLRDRSLIVERQCAEAANLDLALMRAKDPRNYWTDGTDNQTRANTSFTVANLPEDAQMMVDSHSTSPIFIDDNQQMVWAGVKAGVIGGDEVIESLPFQHKDRLRLSLKKREEGQAQMMKELMQRDPEAAAKAMKG